MNNFNLSRKSEKDVETPFSNRAQNYYPEILTVQENLPSQEEKIFDINDLSQFQQDFSYLQNAKNQENSLKNEEKIQKNTENITENAFFSNFNNKKLNSQSKNSNFSIIKDIFPTENIGERNEFQKNNQKNGINIEKIMNFLKNGSQKDLISSALASGIFKNQNPMMVETLSKMLTQKNSPQQKKHTPSPDTDVYEEM